MRIGAVVLAAGLSSRMGEGHPKLLLEWVSGKAIIAQVVSQLTPETLNLAEIIVVVGHRSDEIIAALPHDDRLRVVFNPDYTSGELLSSLKTGLRTLSPDIDAAMVIPGDMPRLTTQTIQQVLNAHQTDQITAPSYQGERGHPVIIDKRFWPEMLALPAHRQPRDVLKVHSVHRVEVDTDSVIDDLDTIEAYHLALERAKFDLLPETTLLKISDHVYWMTPGAPDRPALCAVVGSRFTLMLDAGASAAHARLFLDALVAEGIPAPRYVALTHWHWDHIFGAAELNIPVIAHTTTAERLAVLSSYAWDDAALDARVEAGEEIAFCADNIKLELPEPRDIRIVMPEIIFHDSLAFDLGGVTCSIQYVGGDHAPDSCVMLIEPDGVLFLGDCLYDAIYAPMRHFTRERALPLIDRVRSFKARYYVEGHMPTLTPPDELIVLTDKMRLACQLVDEIGRDEAAVLAAAEARIGHPPDEDLRDFLSAFLNSPNIS